FIGRSGGGDDGAASAQHVPDEVAGVAFVIDDEDAQAVERGSVTEASARARGRHSRGGVVPGVDGGRVGGADRKRDDKRGAAARAFAGGPDGAAMNLGQLLDDG